MDHRNQGTTEQASAKKRGRQSNESERGRERGVAIVPPEPAIESHRPSENEEGGGEPRRHDAGRGR